VHDCVANEFRLEFPAPAGMYMGHRDSYAAYVLCQDRKTVQYFPASALCEEKWSHNSSGFETRLEEEDSVEEDNVIEEIYSKVERDDDEELVVPETEYEVVPETQEYLQVVLFETQTQS
jgi:hypothetical protein